MLIALILGAGFSGAAMCYVLTKKQVSTGIISIGVDYFQVLSMFASTNVDWPESVERIYLAMSFFNFNLGITAPECAFTISYARKWWIIVIVPLGGFFAMLFLAKYKTFHKRFVKHRMGSKASRPTSTRSSARACMRSTSSTSTSARSPSISSTAARSSPPTAWRTRAKTARGT